LTFPADLLPADFLIPPGVGTCLLLSSGKRWQSLTKEQSGVPGEVNATLFFIGKTEEVMASIYKFIELVGTSPNSWEEAAKSAVETAAKTLRELRVAEVKELDMIIENGKVAAYRAKVKISFKYEG
jgi:flavin-binding protein dodecin